MSFMNDYKRLDNYCKSKSEYKNGITSYIEKMKASSVEKHRCISWQEDYSRLKRYRHIRNRLAHEDGVYEKDVCKGSDKRWLKKFRSRLVKGSDPLSLYKMSQRAMSKGNKRTRKKEKSRALAWLVAAAFAALIAAVLLYFLLA